MGAVRDLFVPSLRKEANGRPTLVPLAEVADVRVVEGPAAIKSENGLLRNYVRLNVRDANAADFVARAREIVAREVKLPEGTILEWTGQFEHEAHARATLRVIVPLVLALIFLILYWTYHDLADAALMMLAVPGAIAGAVFFQWLFGFKFSVNVWVGYIACFGMATSTGIIMLVYLREAVAKAGGIAALDAQGLRRAVLEGAVSHHGENPEQAKEMHEMMKRLLGEFPDGKLNVNDEGAIAMAVAHEDGRVVLTFPKPVKWIGLRPEEAIDLAVMLTTHAKSAREKERK